MAPPLQFLLKVKHNPPAQLGPLKILIVLLTMACSAKGADVNPPKPQPPPHPEEKLILGVQKKDFYEPFMFRIRVECPEINMQFAESQSLDFKLISPKEKIKAVVQLFLREEGTLTFRYEERTLGDCRDKELKESTGYQGYYCYTTTQSVLENANWIMGDGGELIVENLGTGRPEFYQNRKYFNFTFSRDVKTEGLKGKAVFIVAATKPLDVEDKTSFCK